MSASKPSMLAGRWPLAISANDRCNKVTVGQSSRCRRSGVHRLATTRRRPTRPVAFRARLPALQDLYRGQSNVPVRRGVLRFRNCVRPSPPWRRYRSHPAARLKSRSLLLKEPEHGSLFHHHAQPPEGCLLIPRPLDAQFVERLLIVRRELFFFDLSLEQLQVPDCRETSNSPEPLPRP